MGLLDKLKPLPRWKHADPAIRLEAVRELDDPAALAGLAEADPDPKIRRAAIARVDDVDVLARVAASDGDEEARDRAADKLLAFALDAAPTEQVALNAARGLSDTRRLSSVAKNAAIAAVRADALARVTDERALGSIARHAKDEATARAALDRTTAAEEVLTVALNAEHRDIALAAFDRLIPPDSQDVALLTTIESRAQQKPVAKRARAILQEIETADAAKRAAEEARRQNQLAICEAIGLLANDVDPSHAEAELTRLTGQWQAIGDEGDIRTRVDAAIERVHAAIALRRHEAEEAAERARVRAEALATREALCTRVETLDGDDALEQLGAIDEEWRSLLPLVGNGPEADRLAERFAQAAAACRTRHELGAMLAETRATLEARVGEAEGLPSKEDKTATLARWQAITREARGLAAVLSGASRPADDLTTRLEAVGHIFTTRDEQARAAVLKTQQDFVLRLERLAERAKRASDADAVTLREGERLMRDLRSAIDEATRFPGPDVAREIDAAVAKLRAVQEAVAPRVREVREMDEWRRFANAQAQEQLIIQAETLVATLAKDDLEGRPSDLAAAARALRDLHGKWKDAADAPRDHAQRLWERFRIATDLIRLRCETYFTKLREERGANLERRTAIVAEAEQLANSTDWAKTTARLQELQTEWRAAGPAPRDESRDLAHRFRDACQNFFSRRREELTTRKKMWADNLAKKEALCERAEVLAASTDWEAASAEMKRLQTEWKAIGQVRRNKSEVIWARFRAAADKFFERFHNRHQIALQSKLAEREALVVELEALVVADPPASDLGERVAQLRMAWTRSVPIPGNEMKALADRWHGGLLAVVNKAADAFRGSDLDPAAVRQRMQKLVARVEALVSHQPDTPAKTTSQTELLAAKLRSAFATNAMGASINDETRWRTAADTVKEAQGSWQRLAPVAGEEGRRLEARFNEACRRVLDQVRRHTNANRPAPRQTAAAV